MHNMENFWTLTPIETSLLATMAATLLLQLAYYAFLYAKVSQGKQGKGKEETAPGKACPPASIIICAKDASQELLENLPPILEQDYPQFEVIIVNDNAAEPISHELEALRERYTNLYITFTPDSARYVSHKKLAVTIGIKASQYDWVVLTESNCRPKSKEWLRTMARNFTPGTDIVLGYSCLKDKRKMRVFDHFFHTVRFLALAAIGKPYMGTGYNLAYRKELFFRNKGFSSHLNLQRGEDDIFVNETACRRNTRIEASPEACMEITPGHTQRWKEEKMNRAITSQYCKGGQRYLLGFETASRFLFLAACLLLIADAACNRTGLPAIAALLAYAARMACQCLLWQKTARATGGPHSRFCHLLPLFDFTIPLNDLRYRILKKAKIREFTRK